MSDQDADAPRPVGRPTLYSPELATKFCERMINGESMRSICRDESMPCASTICLWRTKHAEFSEQYAIAQDIRAELGFDDIQEIADDGRNDWVATNDPENPGYRANGEHIQRSRLRVDTMKWRLARMSPKKYGERTTIAGDPEAPLLPAQAAAETAKAIREANDPNLASQVYANVMTGKKTPGA